MASRTNHRVLMCLIHHPKHQSEAGSQSKTTLSAFYRYRVTPVLSVFSFPKHPNLFTSCTQWLQSGPSAECTAVNHQSCTSAPKPGPLPQERRWGAMKHHPVAGLGQALLPQRKSTCYRCVKHYKVNCHAISI